MTNLLHELRTTASPRVLIDGLKGYRFLSLPEGVSIVGAKIHFARGVYRAEDVQALVDMHKHCQIEGGR